MTLSIFYTFSSIFVSAKPSTSTSADSDDDAAAAAVLLPVLLLGTLGLAALLSNDCCFCCSVMPASENAFFRIDVSI